ncbi:MAG: beta-galactosidase domain 4-containing protein [Bacteroidota bacterium]
MEARFSPKKDTEYHLNLMARQREETSWAPAGHLVGWEQFALNNPSRPNPPASPLPAPNISREGFAYIVEGPDFRYTIDSRNGRFSQMRYKGQTVEVYGPSINLWRAPVDNDMGGAERSFLHQWESYGLGHTMMKELDNMPEPVVEDGMVKCQSSGRLVADKGQFPYQIQYAIDGKGEIHTTVSLEVPEDAPPLPRVGTIWNFPTSFDQLSWFGRGPVENYWDRKAGTPVGQYAGTVAEQYVDYGLPQEHGNKTDVRWVRLQNSRGTGLEVRAKETLLSVNASQYSLRNLTRAKHPYDLIPAAGHDLHIDMKQMGIGGDDSWNPRTHPEFLLTEKAYRYTYIVRPFAE